MSTRAFAIYDDRSSKPYVRCGFIDADNRFSLRRNSIINGAPQTNTSNRRVCYSFFREWNDRLVVFSDRLGLDNDPELKSDLERELELHKIQVRSITTSSDAGGIVCGVASGLA